MIRIKLWEPCRECKHGVPFVSRESSEGFCKPVWTVTCAHAGVCKVAEVAGPLIKRGESE